MGHIEKQTDRKIDERKRERERDIIYPNTQTDK
jgi:hypothetical protein